MSSLFVCPCGQRFAVPPAPVAQQARCPRCSVLLHIPGTPPVAVLLPSSAPARSSRLPLLVAGLIFVLATVLGGYLAIAQRPKLSGRSAEKPQAKAAPKKIDSTPAPEIPTAPAPTPKPAPPEERNSEPTPPAPPVIEPAASVVHRLNQVRQAIGLAPVVLDPELSRECMRFAEWLAPSEPNVGKGETRLKIHLNRPPLPALENLLATPFGRLELLDANLARIGVATLRQEKNDWVVTVFQPQRDKQGTPPGPRAVFYPEDGQRDVPVAFPGNEVPDPIPESKNKIAGFPITVTFPEGSRIRKATAQLLDDKGNRLPAWFSSPEQPANPSFRNYQGTTLCLIARDLLRHGENYTVEMSAEIDGRAWSRRWSFSTMSRAFEIHGLVPQILSQLNAVRRAAGLHPLAFDEELSQACQSHAEYIARNASRPNLDFNSEDPALPGHTKEGQRIARSAQISSAPSDPSSMVDSWIGSFHYRFPVLDREARKVGIGCAHGPRDWYTVLLPIDPGPAPRLPLLYPVASQTDVPLDYESGERPDPIPASKDRQAGFPITVQFPAGVRITGVTASLVQGDEEVPFWLSTPERPVAEGFQRNTVCLIARRPLKPDSSYTVRVSVRQGGKPWEQTWSFRTRADSAVEQERVATQIVARVNQHRRLAGLPPVALDVDLSRGCLGHAGYLMRNLNDPSTKGLGMHDEDPKLPSFTAEGRKAGAAAVIAAGMPPLASVEDWIGTFYHRVPLLDPDLGRIGFGFARGGPAGWITVLNATTGKGRDSTFHFPATEQRDVPLRGADGTGYPITVAFPAGRRVLNVKATLRGAGKDVSVKLLVPENSQEAKTANAVVVVPETPLLPGITYTMSLQVRLDRQAWAQTWNFTTRD
jgi:uncharacterized protein YkwD